jgi:ATP-binding cassette subfamily F protein 3
MQDRRAVLEAEVSKTETEIGGLETSLGNFVSVDETVRLNDLLTARKAALEKLVAEWEEVVQSIEASA